MMKQIFFAAGLGGAVLAINTGSRDSAISTDNEHDEMRKQLDEQLKKIKTEGSDKDVRQKEEIMLKVDVLDEKRFTCPEMMVGDGNGGCRVPPEFTPHRLFGVHHAKDLYLTSLGNVVAAVFQNDKTNKSHLVMGELDGLDVSWGSPVQISNINIAQPRVALADAGDNTSFITVVGRNCTDPNVDASAHAWFSRLRCASSQDTDFSRKFSVNFEHVKLGLTRSRLSVSPLVNGHAAVLVSRESETEAVLLDLTWDKEQGGDAKVGTTRIYGNKVTMLDSVALTPHDIVVGFKTQAQTAATNGAPVNWEAGAVRLTVHEDMGTDGSSKLSMMSMSNMGGAPKALTLEGSKQLIYERSLFKITDSLAGYSYFSGSDKALMTQVLQLQPDGSMISTQAGMSAMEQQASAKNVRGLNVLRSLNEPIAATAYTSPKGVYVQLFPLKDNIFEVNKKQNLLLFDAPESDFGGFQVVSLQDLINVAVWTDSKGQGHYQPFAVAKEEEDEESIIAMGVDYAQEIVV